MDRPGDNYYNVLRTKQVGNSFEAIKTERKSLVVKTKFGAAERIMMRASCQFGACTKVFSSPLITLNTYRSDPNVWKNYLIFGIFWCSVWSRLTPKMDTASSEIGAGLFCRNQQGRGSLVHSPAELLLHLVRVQLWLMKHIFACWVVDEQ
jgi:hypothetical protein